VHLDRFDGYLGDELIVTSRQPLHDGARELLKRGFAPDERMTIRHEGRDYDSFEPRPLDELAQWTITESDRAGLYRRTWAPFDASRFNHVESPASEAA
jgi:hypothetical protein